MSVEMHEMHNYPLRSIYFYPTESCNLRCMHCWLHPPYAPNDRVYQLQNQANVSVGVMEKVVRDALPLGLTHIKFTGGEPFLNPQIFDYLDVFTRYNLCFSFETNGTLFTRETVKGLRGYNIKRISISLDGSTPQIHERIRGVKGSFDRTINGIQQLIEHGIYPQIIFCLQRINAADLENTILLSGEMGIKSFEINPFIPFGGDRVQGQGCEALTVEELLEIEGLVEDAFPAAYPQMHIDLYLPPAAKGIRALSRHALCKCNILTICGILSNGDVSICGIGKRKQDLVMGNVNDKGIVQIWEEGEVFREIRKKIPFQMEGICGRCLFKYQCMGFCRAGILFKGQRLSAPYALCREMHQKGLFPESRILTERESAIPLGSCQ